MAITLQTAEEEYRKNPDIRKEDITRLKEWLDRQPHLPNLTEVDLIVFYHSCNFSMELTKTTIDLNLSLRTHLKYYFTNRDPIDKANVGGYDLCCLVALPELTAEGYKVFYTVLMDTDPTHFNLELAVKAFVNVSDLVQWEEGSFPGVVIIIDLQGVVFGHVTRLNIMTLKDVLFYLQEAMPVRLKGVHFMNAPSFMDRILALMRPFIKRELLTILHIHTPRVPGVPGTMDRHVAQSTLPREAGGEYQSYEKIRANTLFRMKENRQLLIDEQQLRVQENRRPGKPKDLSSIYGLEGSFKKLDID